MPLFAPQPLKFYVDVRTGKYHTMVGCPEYTLPRDACSAFPYYQQEISGEDELRAVRALRD